jgi:hypothetical protein
MTFVTLEELLDTWQKLMRQSAEIMRTLHSRGYEVTLKIVMNEGKPYISTKVIHKAKGKTNERPTGQ